MSILGLDKLKKPPKTSFFDPKLSTFLTMGIHLFVIFLPFGTIYRLVITIKTRFWVSQVIGNQ